MINLTNKIMLNWWVGAEEKSGAEDKDNRPTNIFTIFKIKYILINLRIIHTQKI